MADAADAFFACVRICKDCQFAKLSRDYGVFKGNQEMVDQ
jgi:hypothetical protein